MIVKLVDHNGNRLSDLEIKAYEGRILTLKILSVVMGAHTPYSPNILVLAEVQE